jgi:hypothetical protein
VSATAVKCANSRTSIVFMPLKVLVVADVVIVARRGPA